MAKGAPHSTEGSGRGGWGEQAGEGARRVGRGRPGGSEKRDTEEEIRRQKPQSGLQRLLGKRPICMVGWGGQPLARATENGRLLTNAPPGVRRRTLELTNARSPRFLRPLCVWGARKGGRGLFPGGPAREPGPRAEPTPGDRGVPSGGPFLPWGSQFINKPYRQRRVTGERPSPPGAPTPAPAPE